MLSIATHIAAGGGSLVPPDLVRLYLQIWFACTSRSGSMLSKVFHGFHDFYVVCHGFFTASPVSMVSMVSMIFYGFHGFHGFHGFY